MTAHIDNQLDAYLDGELPDARRRSFEFHIRTCRECREYLAAYRASLELAKKGEALEDDALPDVPEDLVAAVMAARDS